MNSVIQELRSKPSGVNHHPSPMAPRLGDFLSGEPIREDRERFFRTLAENPAIRADFAATWRLAREVASRPGCAVEQFNQSIRETRLCMRHDDVANIRWHWREAYELAARFDAWDRLYLEGRKIILSRLSTDPPQHSETRQALGKFIRHMAVDLRHAAIRMQGVVDYDAVAVEQGFVGYSHHRPMGVYFVGECLGVAIQERKSRHTLLAHIDEWVGEKSMRHMLSRLPPGQQEARIFGVYSEDPKLHRKVLVLAKQLKLLGIKVVSSDLMSSNHCSTCTIYPETFQLHNRAPGTEGGIAWLMAPLSWCSKFGKPLRLAFDLTRGIESVPAFISQGTAMTLFYHFAQKDLFEVAGVCKSIRPDEVEKMPFIVEAAMRGYEALDRAGDPFLAAAAARVAELKRQGVPFTEELAQQAWIHLISAPKFIGEGAEKWNARRIEIARHHYISNENGQAVLHPKKLGWYEV